jgi:predicted amidophosphoribosyltransferase
LTGPRCSRCGGPTAWPVERCLDCAARRLAFASAQSVAAYRGPARDLVRGWKEHGLRRAAALVAELIAARLTPPAADAVTWVPPDRIRLLERGHHPAHGLARELAGRWELPSAELLDRVGSAPRQTGLGSAERRRNVRGAFVPRAESPQRVLLVDDVYTTGSTVSAAAAALRLGGARTVHVVTFARTVR